MTQPLIQFNSEDLNIRFVKGTGVKHFYPFHSHDSFTFGVVLKGKRIIYCEETQSIICPNECFMINPHQSHACLAEGEVGHDYWAVSIDPLLLQESFKKLTGKEGLPFFSQVRIADASITERFTHWLKMHTDFEQFDLGEFATLFDELISRYGFDSAEQSRPESRAVIRLVSEYIDANLDRVVSLKEVAGVIHLSPFYLNRLFQKEMGVPPYTYLLQKRIKKSMDLLIKTGSIAETTHDLGFSDQSHFTRFFKLNIGITPKRFLDLHRT